jgi:hypothetical protein
MPDYDALAQQHGGAVDYDALAAQHGATSGQPQDTLQKALDYKTGSTLIDAPLGLLQGAARGLISTGIRGGSIIRNATGQPQIDPDYANSLETPTRTSQSLGKFGEQTAEFIAPSNALGKTLTGAPLAIRMLGQAGVGAGVSALQSGGNPTATAVGAGLGAGGEALGSAASKLMQLSKAPKAPTLQNWRDAFAATPSQLIDINKALPTLAKDGIAPSGDVQATQQLIKGKLKDLGDAYHALSPDVKTRLVTPDQITARLQQAQQQYTRRGVVTDEAAYNAIQSQIDKVKEIAAANKGQLDIDDLIHLKQKANGRTNFTSPQADKDVWQSIGNAYRGAADALAPETTPLNRDYANYKSLEEIVDKNVGMGRGVVPSRFEEGIRRGTGPITGALVGGGAGAAIGHTVGAPVLGEMIGNAAGAMLYPKLVKPVADALQNAIDTGQFQRLSAGTQKLVNFAAQRGDSATVQRFLSGLANEAQTARSGRSAELAPQQ